VRRAGLGAQTLRQANVGLDPGREVGCADLANVKKALANSEPCSTGADEDQALIEQPPVTD
jgi:hypothetical protein